MHMNLQPLSFQLRRVTAAHDLIHSVIIGLLIASLGMVGSSAHGAEPTGWFGFRGDGTSAAPSGPSALKLGDSGNLAWKRTMPGRSVAGPIVVGDRVITTSSGGQDGEQLFVTAIGLSDGEPQWEQSFRATGRPFCHPTSANAAPSPVSDGERVFAFFSSNDLICLSVDGDLLWYRGLGHDYPKAGNDVGMASSPVIADGAVIAQIESQGDSFAIGIDVETGQNLWRMDRPRSANWSSPVAVMRPDGSTEVVMQCGKNIVAVDPRSGAEQWVIEEGRDTISSATPAGGLLLLPGDDMLALDVGQSATAPEVAWRKSRVTPSNASAVVSGDRFYSLKGSVLIAASVEDGEVFWQQRLSGLGGTWATPVVAEGRLFVFDQAGVGLMIEDRGDSAETVGEVDLGEGVLASPAIAQGHLIVRGVNSLFCFQ
jgi:outer membrane protein assembly factor BamB